jgi:hypothetical protein
MMIQDNSVEELVKELQIAREKSVLGEYEDSLASFKGIMKKIQFQMTQNLTKQKAYLRWE